MRAYCLNKACSDFVQAASAEAASTKAALAGAAPAGAASAQATPAQGWSKSCSRFVQAFFF